MRSDHLAKSDESPHHKDAHLERARTVEHIGCHDRAIFRESIGKVFDVLPSLQDHRL